MERWDRWRSATSLRLLALALAALPRLLDLRLPSPPMAEDEWEHAFVVGSVQVADGYFDPPLAQQWFEFVGSSGLVVLVLAVVFALPDRHTRPATRWAAGLLAAYGVISGWVGMSALEHADSAGMGEQFFLAPFYFLSALALLASLRVARRTTPPD
ncbi:hypothetical protein HII36_13220 [Nonomuraea sp. NN258]|uniref:hypothetical protein n=1 Tax=Nonomuraea antri TaxID=2730852 RepID=UPI0015696B8B|nr:hypothetical protein [Nonomuraea antri]NRQ32793.1 hypothetical protein [Nonomuraea antri]